MSGVGGFWNEQKEKLNLRHLGKKTRIVLIVLVVAAIVLIIANPFGNVTAESAKSALESGCRRLEGNSQAVKTENSALAGVLYDELALKLSDNEYTFYIFEDDKSLVQKYTDGDSDKYVFRLNGAKYGSLSGKSYFYDGSDLYDMTKSSEKLEGESKTETLGALMKYLPESCLGKNTYTSMLAFADKNTLEMSEAFYGDGVKAYIDGKSFAESFEGGICMIKFGKSKHIIESPNVG